MKANTFASIAGRNGSIPSHTKRLTALLVRVEKADRKAHALRGKRFGEPPRLDDVAVIQHCIDRVRGVLVSEECRALARRCPLDVFVQSAYEFQGDKLHA